jgi:hypothetical protein
MSQALSRRAVASLATVVVSLLTVVAPTSSAQGADLGVTGARYNPLTPSRILDTRTGNGAPAVAVGAGGTLDLQVTGRGGVPASGVSAVVLNVTVTEPSAGSHLTAFPAGEARPNVSNLNFVTGQTVPNLVTVKLGSGGKVSLFNAAGSVHVLADVAGWYDDGASEEGATTTTAVSTGKLTWAPPALTAPTAITINSDIIKARGTDGHRWYLDNTKDYEITIGTVNTSYGVVIAGGRNVVIKGGYITIPWAGTYTSNAAAYSDMAKRRALLVANQTGTVHIEGLLIDNALGDLTEGIQIQSPNANVQIQNVRIENVHARDQVGYTDNHPDCVQPMGVKALRIDKFTCSTDGQAFYLDNGDGPIVNVDMRRTNVSGTVNTYPYLFHRIQRDNTYPTSLSDVWVNPQPGDSLFNSVSNVLLVGGAYDGRYTATISADVTTASWPDPSLSGGIKRGTPVGGDFAPRSSVGLNYVSPGYLP